METGASDDVPVFYLALTIAPSVSDIREDEFTTA